MHMMLVVHSVLPCWLRQHWSSSQLFWKTTEDGKPCHWKAPYSGCSTHRNRLRYACLTTPSSRDFKPSVLARGCKHRANYREVKAFFCCWVVWIILCWTVGKCQAACLKRHRSQDFFEKALEKTQLVEQFILISLSWVGFHQWPKQSTSETDSPAAPLSVQENLEFCLSPYRACNLRAECTHGDLAPRPRLLSLHCQVCFPTPPPAEIRDQRGNHPACLTWHFLVREAGQILAALLFALAVTHPCFQGNQIGRWCTVTTALFFVFIFYFLQL